MGREGGRERNPCGSTGRRDGCKMGGREGGTERERGEREREREREGERDYYCWDTRKDYNSHTTDISSMKLYYYITFDTSIQYPNQEYIVVSQLTKPETNALQS